MRMPTQTKIGVTAIAVAIALAVLWRTYWASSESALPATGGGLVKALFVDGFPEGSISPFEIDGAPHAVNVVADPSGNNGRAARISLERNDPVNPRRAEIVPEHIPEFREGYFAPFATDVWYAFEMFLPASFVPDAERETLFQFHDAPELPNIFGHQMPPLQVVIEQEEWKLFAFWDSRLVPHADFGDAHSHGGHERALGSVTPDVGKWTSWVIHARWAHRDNQSGHTEIWKDGISLYAADGPNAYNDLRGGPYLKMGVYKWTWPNSQKSTTTSRQIFLRNVCIDFQKIDPAAPRCRR